MTWTGSFCLGQSAGSLAWLDLTFQLSVLMAHVKMTEDTQMFTRWPGRSEWNILLLVTWEAKVPIPLPTFPLQITIFCGESKNFMSITYNSTSKFYLDISLKYPLDLFNKTLIKHLVWSLLLHWWEHPARVPHRGRVLSLPLPRLWGD